MDCRETGTLLIAFHDGELPGADRARVEAHLRACASCRALLADLALADGAAGVPDPGREYWDRFNDRVMERVEGEADGAKVALLRPKPGWMRQQFRYIAPAVAAAALVVVVVRYAGLNPGSPGPAIEPYARQKASPAGGAPPSPALPQIGKTPEAKPPGLRPAGPAVRENPAVDRAEVNAVPSPAEPAPAAGFAREARQSASAAGPAGDRNAPPSPPPSLSDERSAGAAREEREKDTVRSAAKTMAFAAHEPVAAPAPAAGLPSPAPAPSPSRGTAAFGESDTPVKAPGKKAVSIASPRMAAGSSAMNDGKSEEASFCERARSLAAQGRLKEAEAAQRACLRRDPAPSTQESGLVFLAELLDRQSRFDEADAVVESVRRQFPGSVPLERYRRQQSLIRQQQNRLDR